MKVEDTFSNNPWCVDDATAFLKFCCPECDYHIPDLQMFSDHAVENHIKSSALFGEETKNEEGVLLVKQEELEYENNDDYLEQNDAMQTDDYASYSQYEENQGNLLRGIDKKSVRRGGIAICYYTYLLFSVFLYIYFFFSKKNSAYPTLFVRSGFCFKLK